MIRAARWLLAVLVLFASVLLPGLVSAQGPSYFYDGRPIGLRYSDAYVSVRHEVPLSIQRARPSTAATSQGIQTLVENKVTPSITLLSLEPSTQPSVRKDRMSAAAGRQQALVEVRQQLLADPAVDWVYPALVHPPSGQLLLLTNEIVVKVRAGFEPATVSALLPASLRVARVLWGTDDELILELTNPKADDPLSLANTLVTSQLWVEWAHPNFVREYTLAAVPNDPLFPDQWHLQNIGQGGGTVGADAGLVAAWDLTVGSSSIVIAVIDDGVLQSHPDLSPNLWSNPGEVAGNGIDDDGNGRIDDVHGWDFVNNSNDTNPIAGTESHGTAVAGVAAGRGGNGVGIAGACQQCRILPVKVFHGSSFAGDSAVAEAIRYAARYADVLNNSWGGGTPSSMIRSAVEFAVTNGRGGKGAPVLFAAGNYASGYLPATIDDVTRFAIPAGTWVFEWEYLKDVSVSTGFDTAWLDNVAFPDGVVEAFEACASLPSGWSSTGDANWAIVNDATRASSARGGTCAVKAGSITHNQSTRLRVQRTVPAGFLSFNAWVSAETQDGSDNYSLDCFDGVRFSRYTTSGTLVSQSEMLCGNQSNQGKPLQDSTINFPASDARSIAIGASTNFDTRSDYSQWGNGLWVVAPSDGGSLGITTTSGPLPPPYTPNFGDTTFGGTSSATPLVSGIVGLLLSRDPSLTEAQVRERLRLGTRKIGELPYDGQGWNNRYGYGVVSGRLVLTATGSLNLSVNPTAVAPGGSVTVTWGGIPSPSPTDWIGLYTTSAPNSPSITWIYVSCSRTPGSSMTAGSCSFPIPSTVATGNYELRLFANDGHMRLATSNALTVSFASSANLNVSPATTAAGTSVLATWSGITIPGLFDWIGLYAPTAPAGPNSPSITWMYVSCSMIPFSSAAAGSCPFPIPGTVAAGTYELRLFSNNGYTRLATSNALTVDTPPATPSNLGQFKSDGSTVIGAGGTTAETTVVLKGTVSDPNGGQTVKLQVEVRPLATTFSNTMTNEGALVGSGNQAAVTVSGLSAGTSYHWQARAVDNLGTPSTVWTAFGGNAESATDFTVSASPSPNLSVSPTTVTSGGNVTATWGGIPSPSSRDWIGLYAPAAANSPSITWMFVSCSKTPGSAAVAGSCPFLIPGTVATGTYELRLFSNDGYTKLATSNSLTVTGALLPAPTLLTPGNGATNVSVTPTLDWTAVNGTTSYRIMMATSSGTLPSDPAADTCAGCVINDTPSAGGYVPAAGVLQSGTQYFWQVKGRNTTQLGNWSTKFSVTTAALLSAPTLTAPANGATNVSVMPALSWTTVSAADFGYRIMVATSPGALPTDPTVSTCTGCVINATPVVGVTTYTPGSGVLQPGTTYFWQVHGRSSLTYGTWSTKFSFTTAVTNLPAPTLLTPGNGATNVSVTPTLDWTAVNGTTSYRIMVATSSGTLPSDPAADTCAGCVINDTPSVGGYVPAAGVLQPGTQYFWQVKGRNTTQLGNWSSRFSFTTAALLSPPTPTAPGNGATNVSVTPTLSWTTVSGADFGYRIMVSTSSGALPTDPTVSTCAGCVINATPVVGVTTYTPGSGVLQPGTTYFWQVHGRSSLTYGTWSTKFSFTTASAQAERLTNGGFESGSTSWVRSGNAAFITTTLPNSHLGSGYSYYGADTNGSGVNNGTGAIYQTVFIPSGSTSATLRFWLSVSTQETLSSVFDTLSVEVLNSSGALLSTLATYSNLNNSSGAYSEKIFDLTVFKGQSVRIQFRVTTDVNLPTVFRVDDVSLKSDG